MTCDMPAVKTLIFMPFLFVPLAVIPRQPRKKKSYMNSSELVNKLLMSAVAPTIAREQFGVAPEVGREDCPGRDATPRGGEVTWH